MKDTVPAKLAPNEAVLNAAAAESLWGGAISRLRMPLESAANGNADGPMPPPGTPQGVFARYGYGPGLLEARRATIPAEWKISATAWRKNQSSRDLDRT